MQRLALIICCFFWIVTVSHDSSAADNLYIIESVAVDTRGKTAAIAKKKAVATGQEIAFGRLLKRLTPSSMHHNLPDFTASDIASFIGRMQVAGEKITRYSYRANLTFAFKPDYVKDWMKDNNVTFFASPSKPILLIPLLEQSGAIYLWNRENPWQEAWKKTIQHEELLQIILPSGDLEDIATINAELLRKGDSNTMQAIADKYGAGTVVVADARYEPSAQGTGSIKVIIRTIRPSEVKEQVANFNAGTTGNADTLMLSAARDVLFRMENEWKNKIEQRKSTELVLDTVIYFSTLGEWVKLHTMVQQLPFLKDTKLKWIASRVASIRLTYDGSLEHLLNKMNMHQLFLVEEDDLLVLKTSLE